jgi:hypothetical protein
MIKLDNFRNIIKTLLKNYEPEDILIEIPCFIKWVIQFSYTNSNDQLVVIKELQDVLTYIEHDEQIFLSIREILHQMYVNAYQEEAHNFLIVIDRFISRLRVATSLIEDDNIEEILDFPKDNRGVILKLITIIRNILIKIEEKHIIIEYFTK